MIKDQYIILKSQDNILEIVYNFYKEFVKNPLVHNIKDFQNTFNMWITVKRVNPDMLISHIIAYYDNKFGVMKVKDKMGNVIYER